MQKKNISVIVCVFLSVVSVTHAADKPQMKMGSHGLEVSLNTGEQQVPQFFKEVAVAAQSLVKPGQTTQVDTDNGVIKMQLVRSYKNDQGQRCQEVDMGMQVRGREEAYDANICKRDDGTSDMTYAALQ